MKKKIHKLGGRVWRISQNLIFFFKKWKNEENGLKKKYNFTYWAGESAFYEIFFGRQTRHLGAY